MNRQIHELINMKARKIELEVELGTSNIDIRHLSSGQLRTIDYDYECGIETSDTLERVNQTILIDEKIILKRH